MNEKNIRKFIYDELSNFEFKRYTKGFKYLEEAIYICITNIDAIENLSKNVFPKIQKKFKEKSLLHVKWCMNQVVNTMYNNTRIQKICDYFNLDVNLKPSLKFIIYTIVCKYNNRK
ncbi:MAG: sporulation initiation factor Spo0A C-terminal domain-containing protein [Clostridia bacterium]